MKIEFYTKNVYGNELMYVKDVELAAKLSRLIGTLTVQESQMKLISDLFDAEWEEVLAPKKS